MTWVQITCAERDQIMAARDLVPISSCTDLDAEFHSAPQMDIEWGDRASEQPVLCEHRYPAWPSADWSQPAAPDRKPCEHYRYEEDPNG